MTDQKDEKPGSETPQGRQTSDPQEPAQVPPAVGSCPASGTWGGGGDDGIDAPAGIGTGAIGTVVCCIMKGFGCRVLATNISEREIAHGVALTRQAGLDDRVSFGYADFHALPYDDASFDQYWSQEAFLHAGDKSRVLSEAHRVVKPGGCLVFTDLLVRHGTPEADRERIYERVKSPDMWDTADYKDALTAAGFALETHADWSDNVPRTYAWVRGALERRRGEFEARIGRDVVDRTSTALQFWVDAARAGRIGWECFIARKPGQGAANSTR